MLIDVDEYNALVSLKKTRDRVRKYRERRREDAARALDPAAAAVTGPVAPRWTNSLPTRQLSMVSLISTRFDSNSLIDSKSESESSADSCPNADQNLVGWGGLRYKICAA